MITEPLSLKLALAFEIIGISGHLSGQDNLPPSPPLLISPSLVVVDGHLKTFIFTIFLSFFNGRFHFFIAIEKQTREKF